MELKDENNKIKPCGHRDWGSDDMAEKIWTPEKKRWKHLELEFIPHEQAPKKREYLMMMKYELELCYAYPSPIKLMTNNGFGILLILVEKIKIDIASNLGRSSTNHR